MMNRATAIVEFRSYPESITEALDRIGAKDILATQSSILIKPNLINDMPFPITTPADCCRALIDYIRSCSDAEIVIGEGCGDAHLETCQVFERLGYNDLAKETGVELVDLNHAPLTTKTDPACSIFPEMHLPEIIFSHYLISVPVLKAHSLADITGALKNMIGAAPPSHYSGQYGSWKKAVFHQNMHRTITELNSYRTPDLSLMDATVGMAEFHLGGAKCNPPLNKMIAGFEALHVDRTGADLLGMDWRDIGHLA